VLHSAYPLSLPLLITHRIFFSANPFASFPDEIPECNSLRVPKIWTIFGVVGILRLLAGKQCSEMLNYDLLIDFVDQSV